VFKINPLHTYLIQDEAITEYVITTRPSPRINSYKFPKNLLKDYETETFKFRRCRKLKGMWYNLNYCMKYTVFKYTSHYALPNKVNIFYGPYVSSKYKQLKSSKTPVDILTPYWKKK